MVTIQGEVTRLPRVEFVLHQIRILFESQLYGTVESDNRKPQHWMIAERAAT